MTSRFPALREAVLTASGVLANFGGVPLAFAFVATLGNSGVLTRQLGLTDKGWDLYSFWGLVIVYLYFLIPLMVLTITPALDGLRVQWREAAQNNGATGPQYWLHVALPVLAPSLLGGLHAGADDRLVHVADGGDDGVGASGPVGDVGLALAVDADAGDADLIVGAGLFGGSLLLGLGGSVEGARAGQRGGQRGRVAEEVTAVEPVHRESPLGKVYRSQQQRGWGLFQ